MEWCKFYAEWGVDPKVQSMSEQMRCRHAMLLSLRCAHDVTLLSHEELLYYFRLTPEQLQETKDLFVSKGFINNKWKILKWDKRQKSMSAGALRMQRVRERRRNVLRNSDETGGATDTRTDDADVAQLAPVRDEIRLDKSREEKNTPRAPRRGGTLIDFILPPWIPENDWLDWLAMRKAKRAPTTIGAMNRAVKDLDKLRAAGDPPDAVLQQSTLRCWTGLFPISQPYTNGKPDPGAVKPVKRPMISPEEERRASEALGRELDY